MKRLKKAILLPVRFMAYRLNGLRLYYWSEQELYDLRTVYVMPELYYRGLFHVCMRMASTKTMRRLAHRAIHTIPYHVRFRVA